MTVHVNPRKPDHPIDPAFFERWSPRAFGDAAITKDELNVIFEAARWAPSSFNSQPWRFLYALRGTEAFARFVDLLVPFNQDWARHASALVFVVSSSTFVRPGNTEPQSTRSYSFDTGAAWGHLALQATKLGWYTHGMGGLDYERAKTELRLPPECKVECAVAIGKLGDKAALPEQLRDGETPSPRKPLAEFVFEGGFPG